MTEKELRELKWAVTRQDEPSGFNGQQLSWIWRDMMDEDMHKKSRAEGQPDYSFDPNYFSKIQDEMHRRLEFYDKLKRGTRSHRKSGGLNMTSGSPGSTNHKPKDSYPLQSLFESNDTSLSELDIQIKKLSGRDLFLCHRGVEEKFGNHAFLKMVDKVTDERMAEEKKSRP